MASPSLSCSIVFSIPMQVVVSLSFSCTLWSAGTAKSTIQQVLFFIFSLLTITRFRRLKMSEKCVGLFFQDWFLFVWSNLKFFHYSQLIIWLTQLYLVLYSFDFNLLHSLTMWLIVASTSPHNRHLLFCCIMFIVALV